LATAGDRKAAPKGSMGSRATGVRISTRRVREVHPSTPRLVSTRSRAGLGPTRKERRREARAVSAVLWWSVLCLLVLSGSLVALHSWAFLSGDRPDTTVPDVVAMPYDDAAQLVEEAGLILKIRTETYSDDVDADLVIEQLPVSGAHVKTGREVLVDVSLGSRTLTTPNVIGLDRAEAMSILENLGVTCRTLTPRYSDVAPPGKVINQSPPPGAPIALGEPVEIVTSAGPLNRAVPMKRLEGLPYAEALKMIAEDRLVLRRVSWTYVPGVEEEIVSSQYPLPGAQVMQGSEVLLTVSAPVEMQSTGKRTTRVAVTVPGSAGTVRVRITVQDRYETEEVYSQEHTGPATVEQLVTSYGRTTIRVYLGNRIIREETF